MELHGSMQHEQQFLPCFCCYRRRRCCCNFNSLQPLEILAYTKQIDYSMQCAAKNVSAQERVSEWIHSKENDLNKFPNGLALFDEKEGTWLKSLRNLFKFRMASMSCNGMV